MLNDNDVKKHVGEKIKKFRTEKNITQQELAEYLNTTSQTISRYETGVLEANQNVLFSLADYFNVSINDFFPPTSVKDDNVLNETQVLFDKYNQLKEE